MQALENLVMAATKKLAGEAENAALETHITQAKVLPGKESVFSPPQENCSRNCQS